MTLASSHSAPDTAALERRMALEPSSPLFARLAARYIDANRPAQALKLCLQGMRIYPEYPTGLLLIAKAQVMLRQYSDARETLHELLRIQPSCRAGSDLLDRMKELELEYPPYTASAGSYFVQVGLGREHDSDHTTQFSRQDDILPGFEIRRPDSAGTGPGSASGDSAGAAAASADVGRGDDTTAPKRPSFDFESLASRLENARIPTLPEEEEAADSATGEPEEMETVNLDARPITETLIDIYVQQGRFREAIDALQRLAGRNPDRRDELTAKIRELEQRLEDTGRQG